MQIRHINDCLWGNAAKTVCNVDAGYISNADQAGVDIYYVSG